MFSKHYNFKKNSRRTILPVTIKTLLTKTELTSLLHCLTLLELMYMHDTLHLTYIYTRMLGHTFNPNLIVYVYMLQRCKGRTSLSHCHH